LIKEIRASVENYANIFILTIGNLRSVFLTKVRQNFKRNSRIFFGKNRLMAMALGRNAEDEISKDLHFISEIIKGQCVLMFTNDSLKDVKRYFEEFHESDYARAGAIVTQTVGLQEGPLENIAGSLEPHLRKLGLPVKLDNGIVTLLSDYTICKEGETLNSDQAKLLNIFEFKLVDFELSPIAYWSKERGFSRFDDNVPIT